MIKSNKKVVNKLQKYIHTHIIYAYMMHIYTHNAIHIYCLYIHIYILHTDANLACYSWQQMHFNAPRKESGKARNSLLFIFFFNAFFTSGWIILQKKKKFCCCVMAG